MKYYVKAPTSRNTVACMDLVFVKLYPLLLFYNIVIQKINNCSVGFYDENQEIVYQDRGVFRTLSHISFNIFNISTFSIYFWMEAKMQYNCLYKQITWFNRIINLKITKSTTKIKKQKDTVRNLCKYWLWYLFRLLTFQTSFENSFQTKNKFQIF